MTLLLNAREQIKSMKQTTFWRCFLTEDSFNGLKHLMQKVTAVASLTRVRVVVDHTMPTKPHNKVTDLALIFWSVSLPNQDFIFCQKHLWTGPITLIGLFLVSHFNFVFVPCGGLSWLPISFLLHVKYTLNQSINQSPELTMAPNSQSSEAIDW